MAGTRLHVLLSVLIPILFIAPYAYHLLQVPRSPLPVDEIKAIDLHASTEALRSQLVASQTITLVQMMESAPSFPLLPRISRGSSSSFPSLSAVPVPSLDGPLHVQDEALKSWLDAATLTDRVVIVLLCRKDSSADTPQPVTMGVHRHGWSAGCHLSKDQQHVLLDTLFPSPSSTNASSIAKPALKYRFSFTVLNEKPPQDPAVAAAWTSALATALTTFEPFADVVSTALAAVAIDTQRVEYGKLAKAYRVDPTTKEVYVSTADLQHFKSANDFATTSVLADRERVVHFVAALPAADSFHVRSIDRKNSQPEHAFEIPGYGVVAIAHTPAEVPRVMRTFIAHGRHVLGLPSMPPSSPSVAFLPSRSGVATWELDAVVARYLLRHWHATVHTLQALVALVESMPQMAVLPRTQALVAASVASLQNATTPQPLQTKLLHVRTALLAVEEAHYDPTMVAQLYFPQEQVYIVFCPLLLPLLVPLVGGLVREAKRYRQRRKVSKRDD